MNTDELIFSIIIPTYRRPERLKTCLESLAKLDYPRDRFEAVVVNDGGEISLESTLTPFQNQFNLSLLNQSNSGPARARNRGGLAAKGKYLAFTDDDCTVSPDWLKNLEVCLAKSPDSLIGGRTINALTDNLYSTASQELIDYLYSYYNANPEEARFFTSNNFAVSADRFRNLGGFDTTFPLAAGEDREFCDRWLHSGYRMVYAPEAEVYHSHDMTLSKFWKQQFNYGRGAFRFQQITANRGSQKLQQSSFYLNLLTYPFSHPKSPHSVFSIAGLFFLSQVAIATGLLQEKLGQS